jgi:hypothetical protein
LAGLEPGRQYNVKKYAGDFKIQYHTRFLVQSELKINRQTCLATPGTKDMARLYESKNQKTVFTIILFK